MVAAEKVFLAFMFRPKQYMLEVFADACRGNLADSVWNSVFYEWFGRLCRPILLG